MNRADLNQMAKLIYRASLIRATYLGSRLHSPEVERSTRGWWRNDLLSLYRTRTLTPRTHDIVYRDIMLLELIALQSKH